MKTGQIGIVLREESNFDQPRVPKFDQEQFFKRSAGWPMIRRAIVGAPPFFLFESRRWSWIERMRLTKQGLIRMPSHSW